MDFVFFGGHFEFFGQMVRDLEPRNIGGLGQSKNSRNIQSLAECEATYYKRYERLRSFLGFRSRTSEPQSSKWPPKQNISPIDIKVSDHYFNNVFLRISARALIEDFGTKDGRF